MTIHQDINFHLKTTSNRRIKDSIQSYINIKNQEIVKKTDELKNNSQ